jgi:hypothetical protein
MNINEAFRLRNRLKDRIRDLKERVAAAEYEKTENATALAGLAHYKKRMKQAR